MKQAFGPLSFIVSLTALAKHFKDTGVDMVKMKTAAGYLELLKGLRYALLGVFALTFLTVFLIAGLVTAEITLVFLATRDPETQMIAIAVIGAANAAAAAGVLLYGFSSRQWLKIAAKTNKTIAKMMKQGKL